MVGTSAQVSIHPPVPRGRPLTLEPCSRQLKPNQFFDSCGEGELSLVSRSWLLANRIHCTVEFDTFAIVFGRSRPVLSHVFLPIAAVRSAQHQFFPTTIQEQVWAVVRVQGFGHILVGDEFHMNRSDMGLCLHDLLVAKCGRQVVMCRRTPSSELVSIQCTPSSQGKESECDHFRVLRGGLQRALPHESKFFDVASFYLAQMLASVSKTTVCPAVEQSSPHMETRLVEKAPEMNYLREVLWPHLFGSNCIPLQSTNVWNWKSLRSNGTHDAGWSASKSDLKMHCQNWVQVNFVQQSAYTPAGSERHSTCNTGLHAAQSPERVEVKDSNMLKPTVGTAQSHKVQSCSPRSMRTELSMSGTSAPAGCISSVRDEMKQGRTDEHSAHMDQSKAKSMTIVAEKSEVRNGISMPGRCPLRADDHEVANTILKQDRKDSCKTFRMDNSDTNEEEEKWSTRESSLARAYDALQMRNATTGISLSRTMNSHTTQHYTLEDDVPTPVWDRSLARSYDALGTEFVALSRTNLAPPSPPAELPPLKRTSLKRAKSRVVGKHRAALVAASAMALDLGKDARFQRQHGQQPAADGVDADSNSCISNAFTPGMWRKPLTSSSPWDIAAKIDPPISLSPRKTASQSSLPPLPFRKSTATSAKASHMPAASPLTTWNLGRTASWKESTSHKIGCGDRFLSF